MHESFDRPNPSFLLALCGSFLLAGCPDDPVGNETESTTGDESTSTTMTPTTVTVTVGMSSSSDTGLDDTSTGTTSSDTSSTSGDPPTSSSSSGEPPPPDSGYGDCANNPEGVACEVGEGCLDNGNAAACSLQECANAGDCAPAPSGDAVVNCDDIDQNGTSDCYLDCFGGAACPEGMECYMDFVCLWPVVAPGGGVCPDADLGDVVPQMIMGDNTGLFDDHVPGCGAGGGEDALYQFTAAADGTYVFDTAGTGFDTVLVVIDGCGGPELGCNDDSGFMILTSELSVDLVTGQSIIIAVDSYDGQVGPFDLNVSFLPPGLCPDEDLGSTVPQMIVGDNTGLGYNHDPSCGGVGGEDAQYQFTAPAAGTYLIDTVGTMFDTVLAVLDGCAGVELSCNDDTMGTTSEIMIDLAAGETVIIVVDSYYGDVGPFNLNIAAL